jgi:hypothetical protein
LPGAAEMHLLMRLKQRHLIEVPVLFVLPGWEESWWIEKKLLVAFCKIGKATIRFVTPDRWSDCPRGTIRLAMDGVLRNSVFEYFSTICHGKSSFVQIWKQWSVIYTKIYAYLWKYRVELLLQREMLRTKVVQKIKTQDLGSITFFFRKSCRLRQCRNIWWRWQYNAAHAHCMPDN